MSQEKPCQDLSMWKGAKPDLFSKAIYLRENMTETEIILWEKLRNKQLLGYKFRRQHPINYFIVDFYCHKLNLVIEIDGEYHKKRKQLQLDIDRTKILEFQGLKVIRFSNEEVISNLSNVIKEINNQIELTESKDKI